MIKFKSKRGVTLTELLVIIAVLGILTLIGIPAFRGYRPNLELSRAVRGLIGDLRYAQQLTVSEQIEHGIRFSTSTDSYQIVKHLQPEQILEEKNLPNEVDFQLITGFSDSEAVFNPYGAAKESGTITLINTKNTTSTIEVSPSGFVKIIK
jgi:prepilin-type N-terminal cleavage/methylation domain-containing protein